MNIKVRKYIIGVSVLLHILFIFLFESIFKFNIFAIPEVSENMLNNPIVFDLQQKEMPKQVIETPEDAKTVEIQKKAKFLSDKNALNRNLQKKPDLKIGDPFSEGLIDSHDQPPVLVSKNKTSAMTDQNKKKDEESQEDNNREKQKTEPANNQDFTWYSDNYHSPNSQTGLKRFDKTLPGIPHNNRDSRVLEKGGLSFNTYDWDYAPYLLTLRERIYRNIFPPIAFTRLGMINGETLLRFKIYPDGELRDLELLDYIGHESLMETSQTAVEISAPFPELPDDFPEPYLEVTGKFRYFVYKTKDK